MVLYKAFPKFSPMFRSLGAALDRMGAALEVTKYTEKLVPSTRFVVFDDKSPSADNAFVAPSASLIGNVSIGQGSSVSYIRA
jgi:hypothetical protein